MSAREEFPPEVVAAVRTTSAEVEAHFSVDEWCQEQAACEQKVALAILRTLRGLGVLAGPHECVVPREPPHAQTIRLHLGEVSAQGMRDILAYHCWLTAAAPRAGTEDDA